MTEDKKYLNSIIYALKSNSHPEYIYIGSSIHPLCDVMYRHMLNHKLHCLGRLNVNYSSLELLKYYDCRIELLEVYPCKNKQELAKRTGWYIRNNACVNVKMSGRDEKTYYQDYIEYFRLKHIQYQHDNADKSSERSKIRYQNNLEKINEQQKLYYQNNKEKIDEAHNKYYQNNKERLRLKNQEVYKNRSPEKKEKDKQRSKIYTQKNSEKISERQKLYYQNNKEKIRQSHNEYYQQKKERLSLK